ncbi:Protein of unknown function [Gryllus bimaculatus]|nr:Protein of unknown function [Gryllus bimaculatus]
MPTKCCCCSVRSASIVVGTLSVVVALTFMGLSAGFSSGIKISCELSCTDSGCSRKCNPPSEAVKMVSNLLAILAIMNAVEVVMSVGLIWGACKVI